MLDEFVFHEMTFYWLDGAKMLADGGTTFGPVPFGLWKRHFPYTEDILVPMSVDPILIQYEGKNYLIDASHDTAVMDKKQLRNNGIYQTSDLEGSLEKLNLTPEAIDVILMTHMHNDHSGGLTVFKDGQWVSRFPNAVIYVNDIEWEAVQHPNNRTRNTYLRENWEAIAPQVTTFTDHVEVVPGIEMFHTGGHSPGHSVIKFSQDDDTVWHLADIFMITEHSNSLWVSANDDYPMDSIAAKEHYLLEGIKNRDKFIFYHDPYYRMIQFDADGHRIVDYLEASTEPPVKMTEAQDRAHPVIKK